MPASAPSIETTVVVVGGGPAGLAAALTLSRALQPTIVLDGATPARNLASPGMGAVLGRDRLEPSTLRAMGHAEIAYYGGEKVIDETASTLTGDAPALLVTTDAGRTIAAQAVLIACGMVDMFPPIENLEPFWGKSVINCPFCHGYELHGRPWGIVCDRPEMLEAAEIYAQWTDDLVFFVTPEVPLAPEREAALSARGFAFERRAIQRLEGDGAALQRVVLEGGACPRDALVLWPQQRHTAFVSDLDLETEADGSLTVDEGFRTSRPGVYAAGDVLYRGHQNINTAMHMGNLAAAAITMDLAKRG